MTERKRARAKPEALAGRARLGRGIGALLSKDATITLIEHGAAAIAATGQGDPDPPCGELARLEVRTAERDRAIDVVEQLERIIRATGGYMTPEDQAWLREARALLVERGRREPEVRATWKDRG